jgi:hypothetical protein
MGIAAFAKLLNHLAIKGRQIVGQDGNFYSIQHLRLLAFKA